MAQPHLRPSSSSARTLAFALLATTLPFASALAQSLPQVRVTDDDTAIRADMRGRGGVVMRPASGTVLEMIDMDGDRYAHRDDNWYLVLLPRDAWGFQRTGWVSGDDVELLPPVARPRAAAAEGPLTDLPARRTAAETAAPAGAPVAARTVATNVAPPPPAMADMVIHFDFGRSELTAEAKARLSEPGAQLKAGAQALSFALEGHADWVGNETFNEKLGLARAESVKKFLSVEYGIAAEKMSVVSFGESQPAAPNSTKEGRAENRRVVVKVKP